MQQRIADHRATEAGGRSMFSPRTVRDVPCVESLLALEDGTLWRGETVGSHGPVHGLVRRLGDLVLVEGDCVAVLRNVRPITFGVELESTLAAAAGGPVRGFVTAAGATLPLHGRVAQAIVRGDIGQP